MRIRPPSTAVSEARVLGRERRGADPDVDRVLRVPPYEQHSLLVSLDSDVSQRAHHPGDGIERVMSAK